MFSTTICEYVSLACDQAEGRLDSSVEWSIFTAGLADMVSDELEPCETLWIEDMDRAIPGFWEYFYRTDHRPLAFE
jgi:hypothetical protein